MKLLKKRIIWTYGELGILKIAMLSLGVALGLSFETILDGFTGFFISIFAISGLLSTLLYIGKSRS